MSKVFPEVEFTRFHREDLPRRISAGNGKRAFAACGHLGALAFRTPDGPAFTYLPIAGDVEVREGDDTADVLVEIEPGDFTALVNDLASGPGLFFPSRVKVVRGSPDRFLGWECGWKALYHGTELFDPGRIDLRDLDGEPLDTSRSFTLDDDRVEMAHFFATAGFIHVRAVFSSDEIARFRVGAAEALSAAREGDDNSWWGVTEGGDKVLTRVLDGTFRAELRGLELDPRLSGLIDLADAELEPDMDSGEAVNVLFKWPDLVEGLGNLPWHRDCGMGGHAIRCPTINLSIFLTPADETTGGLWMLPGSVPYSFPPAYFSKGEVEGSLSVQAEAGDVTLHFGDILHAAHPPTGSQNMRESLIVTWRPPDSNPHDGQLHYNDALKADDGVPVAGRLT